MTKIRPSTPHAVTDTLGVITKYFGAIGLPLLDSKGFMEGTITNVEKEGEEYFFIVDDDYEVKANGSTCVKCPEFFAIQLPRVA